MFTGSLQEAASVTSGNKTLELKLAVEQNRNGRSAFPDFSSELSSLSFSVSSSEFSETSGTYSSGVITFSIAAAPFSNKEITVYAKNGSDIVASGSTTISYAAIGSTVNSSVYLQRYSSATLDGSISLSVATSSGYTISCEVVDSENISVTGSGNPVTVSSSGNTCSIAATSIAPGEYKARFTIKKSGDNNNIREWQEQIINVWPGMATNKWYLSNGSIETSYSITVDEDLVKLYVKGSNPQGLYASTELSDVEASSSNSGTIRHPLDSVNSAISKCTNNSTTKYKIICDGDFTSGFSVGAKNTVKNINVEIVGGGNSANLSSFGGTILIHSTKSVSLKNLKVSGATQGFNLISASSAPPITLENCTSSNNGSTTGSGGGMYIAANTSVLLKNGVVIKENQAANGAGIYLKEGAVLDMEGGTIFDNTAQACGGGIYGSASSVIYLHGSALIGSSTETTAGSQTDSSNKALGTELGQGGGGIYTAGNLYMGYKPGTSVPLPDSFSGGVKRNYAKTGGGILAANSSGTPLVKLAGGSLSYNRAEYGTAGSGGGINMTDGELTIEGSVLISHNFANNSGAGICSENASTVTMTGGEVSYNTTGTSGMGGGLNPCGSSFEMSGGLITHNEAPDGAGIFEECNDFSISGTAEISYNIASGNGGGIYICMDGDCFEMTGGTISNNLATGNGGGIYVGMDAEMEISGGTISDNEAVLGGGLYNTYDTTLSGDVIIAANRASSAGGGIYSTGNLTITGGEFLLNESNLCGGAIYFNSSEKDFLISGYTEFSANSADKNDGTSGGTCGGAIFIENCNSAEINAGQFSENAAAAGGAIYSQSDLTIHKKDSGEDLIFSNNICTSADPSQDIYTDANLYLGGWIAFQNPDEGAILLGSGCQIIILESLTNSGEGYPLYLGNDFGWETGNQIITVSPEASGVDLAEEVTYFIMVDGSVGSLDSYGKLVIP